MKLKAKTFDNWVFNDIELEVDTLF